MFQSLQNGLLSAFKYIRGKSRLTEANMREALQAVEQAMLEADVSYPVVKDFVASVSAKAMGKDVLLALNPDEQLYKIVHEELIGLLGPVDVSLHLRGDVTTLMLCGLQGSGKTTTCAKLGRLLQQNGKKTLLVAADLQRPAAIEQLHVLGKQLDLPVYSEPGAQDPVRVCQNGAKKAAELGCQVVILDTAGRLAIDQELMGQLQRIDNQVQPDQVYLVVDGMTGQDAVNSAKAFNSALELDGVIMTKLDGDARGGALLSVKHVTGVPIKFIGVGEQVDALEPFRPDGMAGRILGQGDMLALISKAHQEFDKEKARQAEEALQTGNFDLGVLRSQLEQLSRPGLLQSLIAYLPGGEAIKQAMGMLDAKQIKPWLGIIDSMTPAERRNPRLIDSSRRMRIAKGAGVTHNQVSDILKQFDSMSSLFSGMAGTGVEERLAKVQQMQRDMMRDPTGNFMRPQKKDTGTRLSSQQKKDDRKAREKELKKRRAEEKRRLRGDE